METEGGGENIVHDGSNVGFVDVQVSNSVPSSDSGRETRLQACTGGTGFQRSLLGQAPLAWLPIIEPLPQSKGSVGGILLKPSHEYQGDPEDIPLASG
eukprot:755381-Pyramimonas_sp.AAC.1